MFVGHVIGTVDGIIQGMDEAVAAILQRTQKQLVGRSYTAITHPQDLAESRSLVASLQNSSRPREIRKRYVSGEGGIVTLDIRMSRIGNGDARRLVGTLSSVPKPPLPRVGPNAADHGPDRLWDRAIDLLMVMRARDRALGGDLFADHAWALLLSIYVAEAEGRILSIESVSGRTGLSIDSVNRWIRVLQSRSLIEPLDPIFGALQLTTAGIDGVERLLTPPTFPAISLADR